MSAMSFSVVTRVLGRRAFSAARFTGASSGTENTLVTKPEDANLDVPHLSGAPEDLTQRVVRIFQKAPSATQSGAHQTKTWRIDWDIVPRANRWEDPLIGYESSGDYMQGTQMHFRSKEDAMRFATNQGWDYYVQEPHKRKIVPKNYSDNFLHVPGKIKHIRTK